MMDEVGTKQLEAPGEEGRPFAVTPVEAPGARAAAWFAVLGQVIFVASWIVAAALEPGFSPIEHSIGELSADPMRHPWLVNIGFVILGASLVALAPGLVAALRRGRARTIAAVLFVLAGACFAAMGLLPVDCRPSVEACRDAFDAGDLSTGHYVRAWLGLALLPILSATPFAVARALWPQPVVPLLIGGAVTGILIGVVAIPVSIADAAPHGVVSIVELAVVQIWIVLVAAGILHATRRPDRPSDPVPLSPREFFGRAWTGEGELAITFFPFFGRLPQRFRCRRDITWISDEVWLVDDRVEFEDGRVEGRQFFCHFVAPDRIRVTANDMPDGGTVTLEEASGYRIWPFRALVPIGPVRVPIRCRDHSRVEPDGTLVQTVRMILFGIPVARMTLRVQPDRAAGP